MLTHGPSQLTITSPSRKVTPGHITYDKPIYRSLTRCSTTIVVIGVCLPLRRFGLISASRSARSTNIPLSRMRSSRSRRSRKSPLVPSISKLIFSTRAHLHTAFYQATLASARTPCRIAPMVSAHTLRANLENNINVGAATLAERSAQ